MKTYVHETKAASQLSVFVILRADGTEIGCVRAHYSDGGVCLVNLFNYGSDNPDAADEKTRFQVNRAGGYGYDKFTAALSGMKIDGHVLANHCAGSIPMPAGGFRDGFEPPKGFRLSNNMRFDANGEPISPCDSDKNDRTAYWAYMSCHKADGLNFLRELGYRVIQAI